MRNSRTYIRVVLFCLIASVCYLNYWNYNQSFQKQPNIYLDIIQGTAPAPQQYRILVVKAAWWLHLKLHLGLRHAFGLFDFIAATASGMTLLALMERADFFRKVSQLEQWISYAAFVFLEAYYLLWLGWYQRPETLPTALWLTLMLAILGWKPRSNLALIYTVLATLTLTFLQALTRADVAFCFYAGVFVYACFRRIELTSPRGFVLPLAAAAAFLAGLVQLVLARKIYPLASYGSTAVFQLRRNFTDPLSIMPFLLFIFPAAWTSWYLVRKRLFAGPTWPGLCLGAVLFLVPWCVMGRIQEVRIFLPFAVTLIPLTVSCVIAALRPSLAPTQGALE